MLHAHIDPIRMERLGLLQRDPKFILGHPNRALRFIGGRMVKVRGGGLLLFSDGLDVILVLFPIRFDSLGFIEGCIRVGRGRACGLPGRGDGLTTERSGLGDGWEGFAPLFTFLLRDLCVLLLHFVSFLTGGEVGLLLHSIGLVGEGQGESMEERAVRVVDDRVEPGAMQHVLDQQQGRWCKTSCIRDDDEDDHECTLDDGRGFAPLVPGKEEQRGDADLLDVETDEKVLDRLGEEESTCVDVSVGFKAPV